MAFYSYDANGNLLQGGGNTLTYNAYNKPVSIQSATATQSFAYGPDLRRYKQVHSSLAGVRTTHYIDKLLEVIRQGDSATYKLYIGETAILTYSTLLGVEDAPPTLHYTLRDRLGSVVSVVDDSNTVIEHRSYDPFGKPRQGSLVSSSPATLSDLIGGTPVTQRGFTDHEHLDDAQLIHMNGRVYDYNLGRFMSVDPFIHGVGNSQGINPYSYIMNNPLAGIDPTGYQCEPAGNSHCGDPIGEAPTSLTDNDATDTPVSNGQDLTVKAPGGNTSDIGKPSNTNSSNDGKPVERVTVTCDKQCQEDAKESGESGNMWAGMGVGGALSLALYDGPQPGPMDVIAVGAVIAVMALPGDSSSQNDDMTNMRGASESTGGDPNNEDPEDDFNEEDIVDVKIEISRRGKPQIRVTMKDGSVRIISRARTKIDVPEPRAAKGMRPQKFRNPLPGSKGKKRAPTNKELKLLDKHTRK